VVGSKVGEPVEQSDVLVPFGQFVGGDVGVGGFEGFAFRLGGGARVDLGGGQLDVAEDVSDVGQRDTGLVEVHRLAVALSRAKDRVFADLAGIERIDMRPGSAAVGGLAGLRHWLDQERPFLTADLSERQMRPPRGVLLVGVPGCGKSLSAKAVAQEWDLPLYRLDMASILGKWVGESEGRLREALSTADHVAPCVLWIDEIEKALAGGGTDSTGVTSRLIGQFLFWLQESQGRVYVVATANEVRTLPSELLRTGRFDALFFVDLPTPAEREEIIKIYLGRYVRTPITQSLISELVAMSEGFAGSDIDAACLQAGRAEVRASADLEDQTIRDLFAGTVPLSQTNPERIEEIRQWGRERARPAYGNPYNMMQSPSSGARRTVLTEPPGARRRRCIGGLSRPRGPTGATGSFGSQHRPWGIPGLGRRTMTPDWQSAGRPLRRPECCHHSTRVESWFDGNPRSISSDATKARGFLTR